LNRPDRHNALNKDLLLALQSEIQASQRDDSVRCIVLTGAGERSFSAGADIIEEKSLSSAQGYARMRWGQAFLDELAQGKPSIAALNGLALGGGLELALACDLRVAAQTAVLALPEAAMGTVPAWGGLPRLVALVGASNAKMMGFTARRYTAHQARSLGLVNAVFPKDELLAQALAMAAEIASHPPRVVEKMKSLVQQSQTDEPGDLDESQARTAELLWNTPARIAAVERFMTRPRLRGDDTIQRGGA
jgi:enoyl-CoA hydratase